MRALAGVFLLFVFGVLAAPSAYAQALRVAPQTTLMISEFDDPMTSEEENKATFTVKLTSQPTGTVTVRWERPWFVTVAPASLSFSTSDWNVEKTFTVTSDPDDRLADAEGTIFLKATGGGYDGVLDGIKVSMPNGETAGVTVSATEVTVVEADDPATNRKENEATYTIRLTKTPKGLETVTLSTLVTDTSTAAVTPAVLVFDFRNWKTPQTVTVVGVNDGLDNTNDKRTTSVTHSISGGGYTGVSVQDVNVTVTDDDPASTSTVLTRVAVAPVAGNPAALDVSWTPANDDGVTGYLVQWKTGGQVYVTNVFRSHTTAKTVSSYRIPFLQPGTAYSVRVTQQGGASGGTMLERSATTMSWDVTIGLHPLDDQTLIVRWPVFPTANKYRIQWKSGTQSYSTAERVAVTGQDAVSYTISGLTVGVRYIARVTAINDQSGSEGGTEITLATSDEVSALLHGFLDDIYADPVAGSATALKVTWTPVTGAAGYVIQWKVGQDTSYNETDKASVSGQAVAEYQIPGLRPGVVYYVRVTAYTSDGSAAIPDGRRSQEVYRAPFPGITGLSVAAVDGRPTELDVSWNAATTEEHSDVTSVAGYTVQWKLASESAFPDENKITVTGRTRRITSLSANTAYTVKVTVRVRHFGRLRDGGFAEGSGTPGMPPAVPSATIATGLAVTEGTAAIFTVTLSHAVPQGGVMVNVDVADVPGSDFVEPENEGRQTVTIPAGQTSYMLTVPTVNDGTVEQSGNITATLADGMGYTVGTPAVALVEVTDDDDESLLRSTPPSSVVTPLGLTIAQPPEPVPENGGMQSYTVVLDAAPAGPVTVTPTSQAPAVVTVSGTLTFTPVNWDEPQPVRLTGVNDDVDNPGDERLATITHTLAESGSPPVSVAAVRVRVLDDDTAGVTVSTTAVTVAVGGAASYTVVLDTEPGGPVTVTPTSSAPAVATVSGVLTFTSATWNVPQPVTVRAGEEATAGQTVTLIHGVVGYGSVTTAAAVTVTVAAAELPAALAEQWLSRFGRTVGTHMTDAVGERLRGPSEPDSHVTVGGYRLPLRAARASRGAALLEGVAGLLGLNPGGGADAPVGEPAPDPRREPESRLRAPDLRALLLGSSFRLNLGSGTADAPRLTAWGRVAGTTFDGREGALTLDGDVLTGTVGVDGAWARWLAGVAVSHSRGDGAYTRPAALGRGDLTHTLTSLHPYLRYAVTDRLDVWGLLGYGWGAVTMDPAAGPALETDTTLVMGVVGSRGVLRTAAEPGGVDLALRTDLMLTRTTSDAVTGAQGRLAAAEGDAHRLRLVLEGARGVTWAEGRQLTPTLQVGLRHDWGDAETGFGLEVGGRVQYADPTLGLTVEGAVRGLVVHADSAYEEWGASGSVRFAPGAWGQGLAVTVAPAWGATASGVEGLWTGSTPAAWVSPSQRSQPGGRVTAEVGYGVAAFARGLLTPYAGTSLAAGADRTYRVGTRWQAAGVTLNLEGARQVAAGTRPVNQGLRVQASWGF